MCNRKKRYIKTKGYTKNEWVDKQSSREQNNTNYTDCHHSVYCTECWTLHVIIIKPTNTHSKYSPELSIEAASLLHGYMEANRKKANLCTLTILYIFCIN